MPTDDLTPQQVQQSGMTPQDLAVRNVLAQAMDYAVEGGTVDALMDDNVTPFWRVFLAALAAAGYEVVPDAEKQKEEDVLQAIADSQRAEELAAGARRPGL